MTEQFNDLSPRTRFPAAIERHAAAQELIRASDALREAVRTGRVARTDYQRYKDAEKAWDEVRG